MATFINSNDKQPQSKVEVLDFNKNQHVEFKDCKMFFKGGLIGEIVSMEDVSLNSSKEYVIKFVIK